MLPLRQLAAPQATVMDTVEVRNYGVLVRASTVICSTRIPFSLNLSHRYVNVALQLVRYWFIDQSYIYNNSPHVDWTVNALHNSHSVNSLQVRW